LVNQFRKFHGELLKDSLRISREKIGEQ
jgi:hypothetical protein